MYMVKWHPVSDIFYNADYRLRVYMYIVLPLPLMRANRKQANRYVIQANWSTFAEPNLSESVQVCSLQMSDSQWHHSPTL